MTTEQTNDLVLRDAEGRYYWLSPELLAQARVPAAQQAELEAALGGDAAGFGQPVGGFSLGLLGYEGRPGNQGGQPGQPGQPGPSGQPGGLLGYEGRPGNQGGSTHHP